jgi:ketosteroid isomerase-like protein
VTEKPETLIERLFEAFNRRDEESMTAVCHEEMEFYAVTGQAVGRSEPYVGPAGLHDYLGDVAKAWEELLITPMEVEREGDRLLVRGRVYVRSRELGIRDMPVAWIWAMRDGRFVRGEVFADPAEAALRFAMISA